MSILRSDIIADMHTHTIFSLHAYSTIEENIRAAKEQNLKYLCISDHYWNDGTDVHRRNEINRIKYMEDRICPWEKDLRVISSSEFNLGQELYEYKKIDNLVWKPIGLHSFVFKNGLESMGLDYLLFLFYDAAKHGYNAFVHLERELYKLNYKSYSKEELAKFMYKIVDLACKNNIYLEVNESSLITDEVGGVDRLITWLTYAKKKDCNIYLGSDAHYSMEIGRFDRSICVLNQIGYPKELVLNCDKDKLKSLFP